VKQQDASYEAGKQALDKFLNEAPLRLQMLDRAIIGQQVNATSRTFKRGGATVEQRSVNYLRHRASEYDKIIRQLHNPRELCSQGIDSHILHLERRRAIATIKKRVLDEIAEKYPWLETECLRQKHRDGVEEDPGEYILPFGPNRGRKLREIDIDYLIRLLGQGFVRKSFRTRIERHLAERCQQEAPASRSPLAS
jgi:hypothetical protein